MFHYLLVLPQTLLTIALSFLRLTGPNLPHKFALIFVSTSLKENKIRLYGSIKKAWKSYNHKSFEIDGFSLKWNELEYTPETPLNQGFHNSFSAMENDKSLFCGKVINVAVSNF